MTVARAWVLYASYVGAIVSENDVPHHVGETVRDVRRVLELIERRLPQRDEKLELTFHVEKI